MTSEQIKKIGERNLGDHELRKEEIDAIFSAAEADAFRMIGYAYAYGLSHGKEAFQNFQLRQACLAATLDVLHMSIDHAPEKTLADALYTCIQEAEHISHDMSAYIEEL